MKKVMLKEVIGTSKVKEEHWVGDGFFVSTIFSVQPSNASVISPFLLMDHAAPRVFPPSSRTKGVGEHPHRGFETVTFAYAGEIAHRDSGGGGGTIGPGGVQWMTAASGVVHEELQSERFARSGGEFEMVQLWVNLPAAHKMTKPRYQGLSDEQFPRIEFGSKTAVGRLVAGDFQNQRGPALTFTPMNIFDLEFVSKGSIEFELPEGSNTLIFVLRKSVQVQGTQELSLRELGIFSQKGTQVQISAEMGAKILVLNGDPILEPIVAHGPFVMNTPDEIHQAIDDYESGKMGHLS